MLLHMLYTKGARRENNVGRCLCVVTIVATDDNDDDDKSGLL